MPSNEPLTDVAAEFATSGTNTSPKSYHPVFAIGTNRPETASTATRNPNWCDEGGTTYGNTCTVTDGDRKDLFDDGLMSTTGQTLSQNFVPPWLHTSIITCVDCHEDSEGDGGTSIPRGPHGSDRPFILRKVDTTISYVICTNNTCGTTATVTYSGIGSTDDEPLFCFNCHRADIYSHGVYGTSNYFLFSRIPHPARADATDSGVLNSDQTANLPRGIACMRCHGGGGGATTTPTSANSKLGNIHGNDYDTAGDGKSNRLIAPNGAWLSWTRPSSGTVVSCTRGSDTSATYAEWGGCSNAGSDGGGTTGATYTYDGT
jgi:hypothetical protein